MTAVLLGQPADASSASRSTANADLLQLVPSDAVIVGVLPELSRLDREFRPLAQALDLPVTDVSLAVQSWLQVAAGFDRDGPVGIAILPPRNASATVPDIVMFVPTSNFDELIRLLEPGSASDGMTRIKLRGRESFAVHRSGFAVIAASHQTVRRVLSASRSFAQELSAEYREHFAGSSLSLWVDLRTFSTSRAFETMRTSLLGQSAITSDLVAGARSVLLTLNLDAESVRLSAHVETVQAVSGPNLLPDGAAVEIPGDQAVALSLGGPWGRRVLDEASAALIAQGTRAKWLTASRADAIRGRLADLVRGLSGLQLYVTPLTEGPAGLASLDVVLTVPSGTSPPTARIEDLVRLAKQEPYAGPRAAAILSRLEFQPQADYVSGVEVAELSLDFSDMAEVNDAALRRIVGRDGLRLKLMPVSQGRVLCQLGGGRGRTVEVASGLMAERSGEVDAAGRADGDQKQAVPPDGQGNARLDDGAVNSAPADAVLRIDPGRLLGLIDRIARAADAPMAGLSMPNLSQTVEFTLRSTGPRSVVVSADISHEMLVMLLRLLPAMDDRRR